MTDPTYGDHRYRGALKFSDHDTYKGFSVEQIPPSRAKAGVGPYRVIFKGKEIFRSEYAGDCKRHVEALVAAYRETTKEFISEWKLPAFPEKDET